MVECYLDAFVWVFLYLKYLSNKKNIKQKLSWYPQYLYYCKRNFSFPNRKFPLKILTFTKDFLCRDICSCIWKIFTWERIFQCSCCLYFLVWSRVQVTIKGSSEALGCEIKTKWGQELKQLIGEGVQEMRKSNALNLLCSTLFFTVLELGMLYCYS